MQKHKPMAQRIFNLKLTMAQHQFIARAAKIQGHGNKSLVVKKLIDREMAFN